MKHKSSATLFITAMMAASIPVCAFAETVRNILTPLYITDPSSNFTYGFGYYSTLRHFFLSPLDQSPTTSPCSGTPIQSQTSYNALPNTGLGPLNQQYQRGPCGGSAAQSTFQLTGYQGGMLMRSWDSSYPTSGSGGKHTVYVYSWAIPSYPTSPAPTQQNPQPLLFQQTTNPNDQNDGLVIQSNVTVQQFEAWNINDGGPPHGNDAGQFTFVVYMRDPNNKTLQYVIYLFSNNKLPNSPQDTGSEGIRYDNGYPYIVSSVQGPSIRSQYYTTTRSDSSGSFSNSTWPGSSPFFRVYITPQNLQNAIGALNECDQIHMYCAGLSTDVLHYTLVEVSLNQEVSYTNNGDAFVMGSSFNAFGVFEINP